MPSLVALLGHTNKPTCGVEDYCSFLGQALARLGIGLEPIRVHWVERGWTGAFLQLWRDSTAWRQRWVLLQYTAGAWSRRGFPIAAIAAMALLRYRGARCAVMFHEPYRWEVSDPSLIARFRGAFQDWVIRHLYRRAEKVVFADPLATISWLPKDSQKATFIPIGGNIPEPTSHSDPSSFKQDAPKTVAVFCLSDPPNQQRELDEISWAMRLVSSDGSRPRLVLLGKGTEEAREPIQRTFEGIPVDVVNLGLRSAEEVSRTLAESDAMLCVRGRLFPRRGSALAGIACNVPIIAYAGAAQHTPLAEAGVEFVPYGDKNALASALARVLVDEKLQAELRARNRRGQEKYFSWNGIARRYADTLGFAAELR